MPDSGIERAITLPDVPKLTDPGLNVPAITEDYLRRLHDAIAAANDDLAKRINEFLSFQEWQEVTPVEITADQDNYILDDFGIIIRLSTDASRTIHGIVAPIVARMVVCLNVGAADIQFLHQSATATAENRIITATAAMVTLAHNQSMSLWYDLVTLRWRQLMM